MTKTRINLFISDKNLSFESDIYFTKKIKEINYKRFLDAVFADSFEKFPITEKYCSKYEIETKKAASSIPEKRYNEVLNYLGENPGKRNLAYLLLKSEEADKLYKLFEKSDI